MTKKKQRELEIAWGKYKAIERQIFLLELDAKIYLKEYYEASITDEVEEIKEEVIETLEPLPDEAKKDIIVDTIQTKAD